MGCGETLFLGSGGYVTCSLLHCPDPTAASDLLENAEKAHRLIDIEETILNAPPGSEQVAI